jgi:hypothetical protein
MAITFGVSSTFGRNNNNGNGGPLTLRRDSYLNDAPRDLNAGGDAFARRGYTNPSITSPARPAARPAGISAFPIFQQRSVTPGPSLAQWGQTYNAYLNQAKMQNMGAWAEQQARLSSLLDDANQRRIAADFSKLGAGVDQRAANELLGLMRASGRSGLGGLDDSDKMARQYADLINNGYRFDQRYLSDQDKFLLRQLQLEKERTELGRTEGRNTRVTNVRNIEGAAGAAGAFFSSATDNLVGDEDRNLALLMSRAGNADAQSQKEYDAALKSLAREKQKVKDGMRKTDLDLVNQMAQNQRGREGIFINTLEAEAQKRRDDQLRAIQLQQEQAQLAAFYRSVQDQQAKAYFDALNAAKLEAFFAQINAGKPPPAPGVSAFRIFNPPPKPKPKPKPSTQLRGRAATSGR